MIAIEYRVRLKDKQHLGGDVTAFYFERPPGFEFRAGEYIDITLINPQSILRRPTSTEASDRFPSPVRLQKSTF